MTILLRFAMVAVPASLVLAACAGAETSNSDESLVGQWEIEQIADDTGEFVPPVDGTSPHMRFTAKSPGETTVAGGTGCNSFSGPVEIDDDGGFSAGMFTMTMMGCPDDRGTQEGLIIGHLTTADSWAVDGETASLSFEGAEVLLLRRIDTSLEGSAWSVTGINNQNGGVQSVIAGTEPALRFGQGGQFRGTAGCNDMNGSYTVEHPSLDVTSLSITRMFCKTPEGVMVQEQDMTTALRDTATYEIDGFSLSLRDAAGSTMLTAKRMSEAKP